MQPFDSTAIIIRPGTIADAEAIAAHRQAMFFEMGYRDDVALDAMTAAFLPWLRQRMTDAEYLAWIAVSPDGVVVAGLGLWLMDWPPHMIGPGARRGNILNVYTELSVSAAGHRAPLNGRRTGLVSCQRYSSRDPACQ